MGLEGGQGTAGGAGGETRVGYCRVSTQDQKLDLQRNALKAAGCVLLFEDHMSGTRAKRPGLEQALAKLGSGSPLRESLMLCGSMFGLRIAKHRFFEASFDLPLLMPPCDHRDLYDPWHGKGRTADKMREAQGTPWIPCSGGASRKRGETGDTNNAIPPAYSEFLGRHALSVLESPNVAGNRLDPVLRGKSG